MSVNDPVAPEFMARVLREREETAETIAALEAIGRKDEALRAVWPTLHPFHRERIKRRAKRNEDPLLDIGLRNAVARFDFRTWDAEIGAEIEAIRSNHRAGKRRTQPKEQAQ